MNALKVGCALALFLAVGCDGAAPAAEVELADEDTKADADGMVKPIGTYYLQGAAEALAAPFFDLLVVKSDKTFYAEYMAPGSSFADPATVVRGTYKLTRTTAGKHYIRFTGLGAEAVKATYTTSGPGLTLTFGDAQPFTMAKSGDVRCDAAADCGLQGLPGDWACTQNTCVATTQSGPVASCNGGALVLEKSPDNDYEYVATIHDAGVVDYFIAESEKSYTQDGVTVTKRFPWMVQVVETAGQKTLVIRDFHLYDGGAEYLTSGPPGTSLTKEGAGMRLSIKGGYMPSSHSVIYYTVGDWFFESCE
ncbi:MAG TPA: hypothetical protein VGQ83_08225 [Polyangia bacterium]|jgi:hypothetical protein